MLNIDETEQWLLAGDCKKCRRQTYCTKRCKRNEDATSSMLYKFVLTKMAKLITKKD